MYEIFGCCCAFFVPGLIYKPALSFDINEGLIFGSNLFRIEYWFDCTQSFHFFHYMLINVCIIAAIRIWMQNKKSLTAGIWKKKLVESVSNILFVAIQITKAKSKNNLKSQFLQNYENIAVEGDFSQTHAKK